MKSIYLKSSFVILCVVCIMLGCLYVKSIRKTYQYELSFIRKNKELHEQLDKCRKELSDLSRLYSEQQSRFRFVFPDESVNSVSAEKSLDEVSSFSENVKLMSEQFLQSIPEKEKATPALFAQFITQQNQSGMLPFHSAESAEDGKQITDSQIEFLQELCKSLHFDMQVTRLWNLRKMHCGIEMEFSAPDHSIPDAKIVSFREEGLVPLVKQNHIPSDEDEDEYIRDDGKSTVVFPFDYLNLMSERKRAVVFPGFEVPFGGLYLHYYCVYSSCCWKLEYRCTEEDFRRAGIHVVNLLPNSKLNLEIHRDIFTVNVQPDSFGRSAFLLIADKTVLPQSVLAIPEKIERKIF